jgi:hypothetical protein
MGGKRSAERNRRRRPEREAVAWKRGEVLCALAAVLLYVVGIPGYPVGFHVDESAIAYNAYTIARTGADEHGVAWPVHFRSFGEWKNAPYIYLLAGVFKLTGPSILGARLLSAALGILTAFVLGVLIRRLTGRLTLAVVAGVTALYTPWLFELSRLVYEVAIHPAAVALLLLAIHQAHRRECWSLLDVMAIGGALALITYGYTTGRLLGPLLALGLLVFAARHWRGVLWVWALYGISLLPLLAFAWAHPGALTARFQSNTYLGDDRPVWTLIGRFTLNYLTDISPMGLLWHGDPIPRHHVPGMGSMLATTVILAAVGVWRVCRENRPDAWWRFLLYALVVSPVPAALTTERVHALRLASLPVLLLVVSVPGLLWLADRRRSGQWALRISVAVLAIQAAVFQWQYYTHGSARTAFFDEGFPQVLRIAAQIQARPIYLPVHGAYVHGYWYGVLLGMDRSQFARLSLHGPVPPGVPVIDTRPCHRCQVIAVRPPYIVYVGW